MSVFMVLYIKITFLFVLHSEVYGIKDPVRVKNSNISATKTLLRKHLCGEINYKIAENSKFSGYGLGMQTI